MLSLMVALAALWIGFSIAASDGIDEACTFAMLGFIGVPSVTAVLLAAANLLDRAAALVGA